MLNTHFIRFEMDLPYSIDCVFSFFNQPENLEKITPPHLNFRMLTPQPVEMFNGQVLDYVISLHRIPLRWTSIITNYNPPFLFVDTQVKGPYSFWYHQHIFQELPNGGTRCIDHVTYACPFGMIGKIIHPFIRRSLNNIFTYRADVIKKNADAFFNS